MWKVISAAVNRFFLKSFEEASTDKPAKSALAIDTPRANVNVAIPLNRDVLHQQFQQAIQVMQGGNAAAAGQIIQAAVAKIVESQPNTPLHADACYKWATILSANGQLDRAEIACRQAVDIPATDDPAKKERLTYQLYLGDILTHQDKLDEAEQVLSENIAARKVIFGAEQIGYAIGLSALADLLLSRERPMEALEKIDESVRILSRAKHERLPGDLVLRAFIVKAAHGPAAPGIEAWPELTRGMQKMLAQQVLRQAKQADPHLAQSVIVELRQRLETTPDIEPQLLLSIDIALANEARENGDHEVHISACQNMVQLCSGMPDRVQLTMAQQALAMALDKAGRVDEVSPAYDAAVATARDVNDLALLSNVLRNHAISADKAGRPEQAEGLHREAVDHGASSGDWSTHGRSTVAYGIFLQHAGRWEEARGLLEEAVAHLSPAHADFASAQEHLQALDQGIDCACKTLPR